MRTCPACGHENSDRAKFCEECAAPLAVAREQRKTVTVLFCDITGSTALGESVDPEALRGLLARYFERMKGIVESHGGTVEKFIGDAVMAVFGVPRVREDDALRAVRAAVQMRDALPELGLQARIGVNTGEVVTGTEERLATGDAVNVAARLEQAARPGDVWLGEVTLALVREAVVVEALEPLELKGKGEPVPAYRLVSVHEPRERRHETRFVGRVGELETLRQAWERVRDKQRCELVTVVGEAGVGKSRLAAEFLSSVEARNVGGRCLPYGEGITYWPVVEVVKRLGVRPSDEAAAAAISSLLDESEAGASAEEIAWAFRKMLEEAAAVRPLVVVFDDIQWGEQTFLDLVEHVGLLSSGAPMLLLCMARPELTQRRAGWPVALSLEPLPEETVRRLLPETIGVGLRERIARAAGGNPLFVEELVAMAVEADGEVALPATLRALLAARLDQLDAGERRVVECAAVEGEVFHRGAVQALAAGGDGQVTPRLAALVRRELIGPYRTQLAGEDGFRFRHLLIRDAAYEALTKSNRAELHERLAGWLGQRGDDLVELDEIVGYHLEQAYGYREQLAPLDERARTLAAGAGELLGKAGSRAFARDDMPAAVSLLDRAVALTTEQGPARLELIHELSGALHSVGEVARAESLLNSLIEAAQATGDRRIEWYAILDRTGRRWQTGVAPEELLATSQSAIAVFEELGDEPGLARGWRQLARAHRGVGSYGASAEASERALEHARRAGNAQVVAGVVDTLCISLLYGPCPVPAAIARCDELLTGVPASRPFEANVVSALAGLEAMRGRFETARSHVERARATYDELGLRFSVAGLTQVAGMIELLAGDAEAAEQALREGYAILAPLGATGYQAALLAEALAVRGKVDQARRLVDVARSTSRGDLTSQVSWRCAAARVVNGEDGVALAREAVAMVAQSDILALHGDACATLAEVLAATGETAEAADTRRTALHLYERKGNVASARRVRALMAEMAT